MEPTDITLPGACDDAAALQPDPTVDRIDADERKRARLAAALLAFVAVAQFAGMLSHGIRPTTTHGLLAAFPHLAIVLPAGAFAFGLWRGRRLRIATIAFALLWSALSVWTAFQLARTFRADGGARRPAGGLARAPVRGAGGRALDLLHRRHDRASSPAVPPARAAWRARRSVIGFAALFVAEHLYQNRRG